MRIVFCTVCTDRLALPAAALPHNLEVLRGTGHALAMCDLGSRDEIEELVRLHIEDIRRGTLLYFRTDEPHDVPFGQALNAGHRLGLRLDPDVLFRLDADHHVTTETLALVDEAFARAGNGDVVLHNWSRVWGDGSMGRIAMTAASWIRLGGYDEATLGRTWQDFDILVRARAHRMSYQLSARGLRQGPP